MTDTAMLDPPSDPTLQKLRLKADEYRARAREAFAAAETTTLDRVRDQRHAAATSWSGLADGQDARIEERRLRLSRGAR